MGRQQGASSAITLPLTVAGTAVGGVGGLALATAGALVDAFVIQPAFAEKADRDPADLSGLRIQTNDEGAPVNWIAGGPARTTGNLITYIGPRILDGSQGSRKAGAALGPDVIYGTTAVLIGDVELDGSQPILKAWANGKPVYLPGQSLTLSATASSPFNFFARFINPAIIPGNPTATSVSVANITLAMKATGSNAVGDPTQLANDARVTLSGMGAPWDGVWRKQDSFLTPAQYIGTYVAAQSWDPSAPTMDSTDWRIVQLQPTFPITLAVSGLPGGSTAQSVGVGFSGFTAGVLEQSGSDFSSQEMSAVRIYTGTELYNPDGANTSQAADPDLEAEFGPGAVPSYLGQSLMVLVDQRYSEYGNRPPQYDLLVNPAGGTKLADVVESICDRQGQMPDGTAVDVSRLPDIEQGGVLVRGPQSMKTMLQSVAIQRDLLARDSGGVLMFYERKNAPTVDIDVADMAVRGATEVAEGYPFATEITDSRDLPTSADVLFFNTDEDYTQGSKPYRSGLEGRENVLGLNLGLPMPASEAIDIARRAVLTARQNRQRFEFTLPPKYMGSVEEGAAVRWEYSGETYTALVERVDETFDGAIRVRARSERATTLDFVGSPVDEPVLGTATTLAPAQVTGYPADLPPMGGSLSSTPHVFWMGSTVGSASTWRGATVYTSSDDDVYVAEDTIDRHTPVGMTTTALAAGAFGSWDMASTVDVEINRGTLTSATRQEVLAGANRIIIGEEVVGFTTATLVGTQTYRLSELLRGIGDTFDAIANHGESEPCVFIGTNDPSTAARLAAPTTFADTSLVGRTTYYKIAAPGDDLEDIPPRIYTYRGRALLPFAPVVTAITVQANSDIKIDWVRRSRGAVNPFALGGDDFETAPRQFRVRLLSEPQVELRDPTIVSGASTFTYTAAMQATDSYTAGSQLIVEVTQLGTFGESKALQAVINPSA